MASLEMLMHSYLPLPLEKRLNEPAAPVAFLIQGLDELTLNKRDAQVSGGKSCSGPSGNQSMQAPML